MLVCGIVVKLAVMHYVGLVTLRVADVKLYLS